MKDLEQQARDEVMVAIPCEVLRVHEHGFIADCPWFTGAVAWGRTEADAKRELSLSIRIKLTYEHSRKS